MTENKIMELLRNAEFFGSLSEASKNRADPVNAMFELTPRCNFLCNMCYVRLPADEVKTYGRELTAAEWISVAEQARNMGVLSIGLTGGEPLLRADFGEIYEALAQMGFLITLQTNCSMMTDGVMALLDRFPPYMIKTTLYGASDGAYEKVCGVKGGLTRVLDGIKKIQKAGIPLAAVATPPRWNNSAASRSSIWISSPVAVAMSTVDNGAATMNFTPWWRAEIAS